MDDPFDNVLCDIDKNEAKNKLSETDDDFMNNYMQATTNKKLRFKLKRLQPRTPTLHASVESNNSLVSEEIMESENTNSCTANIKWCFPSTKLMVTTRLAMEDKFKSGKIPKKTLWNKVSSEMQSNGYNFDGESCDTKFRGLLATYKRNVKKKSTTGENQITWPFFNEMEEVFSQRTSVKNPKKRLLSSSSSLSETSLGAENGKWCFSSTKLLIMTRLALDDKFKSGTVPKKTLWNQVSSKMQDKGYSFDGDSCDCKFRGILATYKRNVKKKNSTGEGQISWPFFNEMDKLFGECISVNIPEEKLATSSSSTYLPLVTSFLSSSPAGSSSAASLIETPPPTIWNEKMKRTPSKKRSKVEIEEEQLRLENEFIAQKLEIARERNAIAKRRAKAAEVKNILLKELVLLKKQKINKRN